MSEQTYGPCSCQDDGRCLYINGGPACMNSADQPAPTPRTEELSTMGKMELALYSEQHDALCAILGTRRISIVEAVRMAGEQLSTKTAEAERLREALKHELVALNIVLTRQRDGDVCRVSVSDLLQGIRMLEQALAATREDSSNG